MSKEKVEQNQLLLELRDKKKLSWQEILEELHRQGYPDLSAPASVKARYYDIKNRLGLPAIKPEKQRSTKAESRQSTKTESKQNTKAESKQVYKRVTYHLAREQIRNLSILAAKRDIQKSKLMRQIVAKYLSRQSDL